MTITTQNHSLRFDTVSYTLKDIQDEIYEDIHLLIALGHKDLAHKTFLAKWQNKARTLGLTSRSPFSTVYAIAINRDFIRVAKPEDVHNTIMHECIHCIDGCFDHQHKWKAVAAQVNAMYKFTPITRCGNSPEYREKVLAAKYKWRITCNGCGNVWNYMRKSRVVNSCANGTARCSCGCKEFTVVPL